MYRVTCNQCGASVITHDGNSDALFCACCPERHSHEANANACPGAGFSHPGGEACGLFTDGCQVCRPCTIEWTGTVPVVPAVIRA